MSRPNQFLSPEGDLEDYFVDESWLIDQWIGDTLLIWGDNSYSQLGINNTSQRNTPVTTLAGGTNWKQVALGRFHAAAIKTDGTLWSWGYNAYGNLGINNTSNRSTPVTTFAGGTNWKQVACSGYHTSAIKTDGTLWSWGRNNNGQLGTNDTTQRNTPVQTSTGGTNWNQVVCGAFYTTAIKTDGTLWSWGSNQLGQLGTNDTTQRNTPVQTLGGGTNWKQVACGSYHTSAIKTDGTLWSWGNNAYGNLGINLSGSTNGRTTPVTTIAGGTNWKQVGCSEASTFAIKTDGTLWSWGFNGYAILGVNDATNRLTPVTTFAGGNNWRRVAQGGQGFCRSTGAIKTDGTLWVWGRNTQGQLGINNTSARSTPVTTIAGGTNWKQVAAGYSGISAVTSGTNPIDFIS